MKFPEKQQAQQAPVEQVASAAETALER
jgi:hypothetical protein